jgi:DNA polymerase-3 subunit chi
MTRVDFYILPDMDTDARDRFACRLANQAVADGQHVHVHVGDADAERDLDELMWAYPAHRFLPHAVSGDPQADRAPVFIGTDAPGPASDQLLINLSDAVPAFFGRFERVAEVIVQPQRNDGRDRYKFYRDRGYPLYHHELDVWE